MKHIDFYFDFISPYAYLAFEKLPQALRGMSYGVDYKPILFAGLLASHGQLGPAEIAPKRDWTYRQVLWLAREHGVPLDLPATHPFNPLPLLRLALACSRDGRPNRHVCETLFRHVWQGGADAADPQRLQALTEKMQPLRDPASAEVKQELQHRTSEALAAGLFGVPSLVAEGKTFWGLDSLPMLRQHLSGDAWFGGPQWDAAAALPTGLTRRKAAS